MLVEEPGESNIVPPALGIGALTGRAWDSGIWTGRQPMRRAKITLKEPSMEAGLCVGAVRKRNDAPNLGICHLPPQAAAVCPATDMDKEAKSHSDDKRGRCGCVQSGFHQLFQ